MLRRRVIVCLDVKDGRVVKGHQFQGLRDVGDPVELAARYEAEGADEICFLDVTASHEGRGTLLDTVQRTAEVLFVPLAVGGGVRTADDMADILRAGADKVTVNSAAVARPELLTECADRFGAQCVVLSIDGLGRSTDTDGVAQNPATDTHSWTVVTHGGRNDTGLDVVDWARTGVELGAGEILLTSIDRDGARIGYQLDLTRAVAEAVGVPVIASGGAGESRHLIDAYEAGADAALVAGILHDGLTTVTDLKQDLETAGVAIR